MQAIELKEVIPAALASQSLEEVELHIMDTLEPHKIKNFCTESGPLAQQDWQFTFEPEFCRVTLKTKDFFSLTQQILSSPFPIRVLQPTWFASELKETLLKMDAQYQQAKDTALLREYG